MHTVIPDPLNGLRRFVDEALHKRRVDAPVMVFTHAVEFFELGELHARLLLHEGLNGKRAFHVVAGAARKGVLFEKHGLEAGFLSACCCNGTAGAAAHHHDIGIDHAIGHSRARHANGRHQSRQLNNLFHLSLLS